MKIVNELLKKGKCVYTTELNIHVESVSKITLEIAEKILCGQNLDHFWPRMIGKKKGISKNPYRNIPQKVFNMRGRFIKLSGNVFIDYPLSCIVEVPVKNVKTIGSLLWHISQAYQEIYEEEKKSSSFTQAMGSVDKKGHQMICKRGKSNGKFGIWGHSLGDLWFEKITIYDNGNIILGIGS